MLAKEAAMTQRTSTDNALAVDAPSRETLVVWRCRHCGKLSSAKRRPTRHQRFQLHDEYDGEYGHERVGWRVWCGPFDRFEAQHADPAAPPHLAEAVQIGEPVSPSERAGLPARRPE